MNARASWTLAQEDFRAALEAIATLEEAVPAFRVRARSFRGPIDEFLACDAATTGGLARLAQTLMSQAEDLAAARQSISSHVAIAKASLQRHRAHLQAADDGRKAYRQLQRIVDSTAQGMSDLDGLLAEADRLLQDAAARLLEGALRFDLPPAAEQLARQLIDRAMA